MNNRWKFVTKRTGDELHLTAIPDVSKMSAYISEASKQLQNKILENEEALILSALPNEALQRLKEKCDLELAKRRHGRP